jgi:protein TonB
MALKLIDRPGLEHEALGHKGLSATASAALHAAVLLTLVWALRVSTHEQITATVAALLPERVTWIADAKIGGGRDGGGAQTIEPPRRARAVGASTISVPAAPQASTDSTIEPPEDIAALPARPMGDATQILVGALDRDGASPGPGDSGAGTSNSSDQGGLGSQPGRGFGDGVTPYGPGVTIPTLISRVDPKYTVQAMQLRVQGATLIECVVQADGTVGDARILRSLDRRYGLDEEGLRAVRLWRFKPGLLNGKPVPVVVTIELMFSLR